MVSVLKLRLSRCVRTVVCHPSIVVHIFTHFIKALNLGCRHLVGDLGVQAEAQYLGCNPCGVERPVFQVVEQSLRYRTFVILPMGI
jgi:hypothetical protein